MNTRFCIGNYTGGDPYLRHGVHQLHSTEIHNGWPIFSASAISSLTTSGRA